MNEGCTKTCQAWLVCTNWGVLGGQKVCSKEEKNEARNFQKDHIRRIQKKKITAEGKYEQPNNGLKTNLMMKAYF